MLAPAISHLTAARAWGLPLLGMTAGRPDFTVSRSQRARVCPGANVHWADLKPEEIDLTPEGELITSKLRTVLDCLRVLPPYAGIALADSALQSGLVEVGMLHLAASRCRGPGSGAVKHAVHLSDGRAQSPQESVARVALSALGPVSPQFLLEEDPFGKHFDLALRWAKIVIDNESRRHHSDWPAVEKDIRRGDVVNGFPGWLLVRTRPAEVWPDPDVLVTKVLRVIAVQPGRRCRQLSRRYVDGYGEVCWPESADTPANAAISGVSKR